LRTAAARLGKELIVVHTNALSFFKSHRLHRLLTLGVFMAAVAHLLGTRRFVVPSSAPLRAPDPVGSHPLTDPMWSSESTRIDYDGNDLFRMDKMRLVNDHGMLDDVVVCFYNFETNCCQCAKCLRTMLGMELQGLDPSAFPEALTPRRVRKFPVGSSPAHAPFGEYLDYARATGQHRWVRAMAAGESAYRLREVARTVLAHLDNRVTGGRLFSLRDRRRAAASPRDRWHFIDH
jgi:hypothetical protein